jgi:hypothetical protein
VSSRKFGALVLMTVGALITALCGTCTFSLTHASHGSGASLFFMIGGAGVFVGLVLLLTGFQEWRHREPPKDAS